MGVASKEEIQGKLKDRARLTGRERLADGRVEASLVIADPGWCHEFGIQRRAATIASVEHQGLRGRDNRRTSPKKSRGKRIGAIGNIDRENARIKAEY